MPALPSDNLKMIYIKKSRRCSTLFCDGIINKNVIIT